MWQEVTVVAAAAAAGQLTPFLVIVLAICCADTSVSLKPTPTETFAFSKDIGKTISLAWLGNTLICGSGMFISLYQKTD
jgi:hypothetical protein